MSRNRPLVAGIAVVAVILVVGVGWVLSRAVGPPPGPKASSTPGPTSSTPDRSAGVPLVATTHVDGTFDAAQTHEPTASPAQSKLWFAADAWWAAIIDPATQELHIARLDPASQRWTDTGTIVDERLHVRADALWDGTHLRRQAQRQPGAPGQPVPL
jgi:hypothetical protein